MRKLSNEQKEFFLKFFVLDEDRTPGWKNVANALLDKGKCIVAGDSCIWKGGIGNFIKTEKSSEAIGCLVYKFDIESFMKSPAYVEARDSELEGIDKELKMLEVKRKEISKL